MSDKKLFPDFHDGSTEEEPWDHRFKPIADLIGCSIDDAARAFGELPDIEYTTREHLDLSKDAFMRLEKARKPAEKLLAAMYSLTDDQRIDLVRRGAVTVYQLEHLADVLAGQADGLKGWYQSHNRTGGRNVAAHAVAEGVRRAFRRNRKPITYGEFDGEPTTLFCRAVRETLAGFRVRADWAEPAHAAWERQKGFVSRLERYKIHLQLVENMALTYPEVDWSRFVFKRLPDSKLHDEIGVFDRLFPNTPPLMLKAGYFLSRKEPAPSSLISWVSEQTKTE